MPSDKRARKRAAREAKMAALERRRQRRTTLRRVVILVVLAAVAGGVYALVSSGGKSKTSATKSTTTTASTTLPPNAASTTTTVSLAGVATSADCPVPFTATTALKKPAFSTEPPNILDPSKTYTATVTTDAGSFTIALDAKDAPRTVNSFVFLAENHFYDCIVFHRVIPGFMDQTGDPLGTGSGGVGYKLQGENLPSQSTGYTAGEVATANAGPNTNGSQFFVLVAPYDPASSSNPAANTYSVFGHVTSGMSVVQKINGDGTSAGTPKTLHRMLSVIISES